MSIYIRITTFICTGKAAILLKNGRTVSTTFKLPLDLDETTTCNIKPNTKEDRSLSNTKILIWDEITMASKIAFNAVDGVMKDLLNSDKPFGNIIVILSGDFRQTLPIVKRGNRTQIIENTVKKSHLWNIFNKISLVENHRLTNADNSFNNWLLSIGDGIFANNIDQQREVIKVPE